MFRRTERADHSRRRWLRDTGRTICNSGSFSDGWYHPVQFVILGQGIFALKDGISVGAGGG